MVKPITPGQVKKIHTLIGALGIDRKLYREVLKNRFGVASSKDLVSFQAGILIDELEERALQAGVWKKSEFREKYDGLDGRPQFASTSQLGLIKDTWNKVSRMETPELKAHALRKLLFKVAKVSDLRFLTKQGAGKVITALRQMEKQTK